MTGRAGGAGLARLWSTPARPLDHFTAEELELSAALHRPLRRIRLAIMAGRVLLLLAAAWLLGDHGPGGGLADEDIWRRALVGAGAVVAALLAPEVAAGRAIAGLDVVEPADPDGLAEGGGRLPLGSVVAGVGVSVGLLALAAVVAPEGLADPSSAWPLVLVGAVTATAVTAVVTAVRGNRAEPIEAPTSWVGLADRAGAGPVRFGLLGEAGLAGVPADLAPNACAMAAGRRRWILVHPLLVPTGPPVGPPPEPGREPAGWPARPEPVHGTSDADEPSVSDFVVAHELAHLAGRHHEVQAGLVALTVIGSLGAIPVLGPSGWPWSLVAVDPSDPRSLPVSALVVLAGSALTRVPVSWVLRWLERSADDRAVDLVGVPDRSMVRNLHLAGGGELAPPWWAMLVSVRPSPVERLELLARRRRSGLSSGPPGPAAQAEGSASVPLDAGSSPAAGRG